MKRAMRELYKKFNELYELVQKQFLSTGSESKSKEASKKKPTKKNSKKDNKENINEENSDIKCEDDDDEIKATAVDQSKIADITLMEQNPVLESTKNNITKSKSSKNSGKKYMPKFNYVHRMSFNALLSLIQICYS